MVKKANKTTSKPIEMVRYPLSSAGRRIGSKIFDILFVGILVLVVGIAIFATDPNFQWKSIEAIQPWRYGLFAMCMILIFFGLLWLLPRLTGWTIGMKIFKLKYFNVLPLSSFGLNIFKHELFVWEIMCFISLVLGATLSFLTPENAKILIAGVLSSSKGIDINAYYYAGVTFACFYYVTVVLLIIVLIGVCIKSKRPAFHDKFSNILVIHLRPTKDLDKQANVKKKGIKRINYGIPGEISSGSFEEIDELE